MASPLFVLICICLGLMALAVALWLFLLAYRWADNGARARRQILADQWLERLLPVLECASPVTSLPKVAGREEMEAVLGLLRDLAERFRGQYREQLETILGHIGGKEYGIGLLRSHRQPSRLRGCALLAWTGPDEVLDQALLTALQDPSGNVRIEAAYALALRRAPSIQLPEMMQALEERGALASDRVRDILRLAAPGRSDQIATLLARATTARQRVLLLNGLSAAGAFDQAPLVTYQLKDSSPQVRAASLQTLTELGDPFAMTAVSQMVTDPAATVRLEVARFATSMSPAQDATEMLLALAMDDNHDVRRLAVYGVAACGAEAWQQLCVAAVSSPAVTALVREVAQARSLSVPLFLTHELQRMV